MKRKLLPLLPHGIVNLYKKSIQERTSYAEYVVVPIFAAALVNYPGTNLLLIVITITISNNRIESQ